MTRRWTIQEVAKSAGTTSRTLRHYDEIGLLKPTSVGDNGYRQYDSSALIRLQRILALRDLGMSLAQIQLVLDRGLTEIEALEDLESQLVQESSRLQRQIASVRRTLSAIQKGESPMAENMFDGFEHEQYKEEVEQKWGQEAWKNSSDWWTSLGEEGQKAYQVRLTDMLNRWKQAYADGKTADSETAQSLAEEQVEWLKQTPGPHTTGECPLDTYVRNLGEMYVNDPRFAENYGGVEGASLVRDALNIYMDKIA